MSEIEQMMECDKYQKCLNFIKELYNLKFDTLTSIDEAIHNEIMSKKAESFLKEIEEFNNIIDNTKGTK